MTLPRSLHALRPKTRPTASCRSSCSISRHLTTTPNFYHNRVLEQYAAQETRRVTLRQLTVFGRTLSEDKLLKSANYVRAELPVRLAHRIFDFQHLPFIVGTNPHIEHVYNLYWTAFETFKAIPPIKTLEQNRDFCETLEHMLNAHLVAIPRLAMGIAESSLHLNPREADRFMNEMLRSRIGRRVLAEQHITLSHVFDGRESQDESFIGIVNTKCKAVDVVNKCAAIVGRVFEDGFGIKPPEVHVDGHLDATFTYIPDQIEYIVFELLKNSMWATLDKHAPHVLKRAPQSVAEEKVAEKSTIQRIGEAWDANARLRTTHSPGGTDHMTPTADDIHPSITSTSSLSPSSSSSPAMTTSLSTPTLPPIRATIGAASSLLTFRISDQGGGIPASTLPYLYSYSHPSKRKFLNFAHVPRLAAKVEEAEHHIVPPSLKLGLGLPMSKVYANYWGGDIEVITLDGYGTDAYVGLKVGNQVENLTYTA
ncbi:branched-chain alpha-ketoacid dehydrogenase [Powellomyces hirtus]|nr:branched-chain alpha-ketoacid dehydrogenase [Powellomyces hirtus]